MAIGPCKVVAMDVARARLSDSSGTNDVGVAASRKGAVGSWPRQGVADLFFVAAQTDTKRG
jgi:hypothetical protein